MQDNVSDYPPPPSHCVLQWGFSGGGRCCFSPSLSVTEQTKMSLKIRTSIKSMIPNRDSLFFCSSALKSIELCFLFELLASPAWDSAWLVGLLAEWMTCEWLNDTVEWYMFGLLPEQLASELADWVALDANHKSLCRLYYYFQRYYYFQQYTTHDNRSGTTTEAHWYEEKKTK